jgi:hypothetical protein
MRIRSFLAVIVLTVLASCSKSSTQPNPSASPAPVSATSIPAAVTSAFNNSFPAASAVEWFRGSSSFTCQFNLGNERHEASFDDSGHNSSHSVICTTAAVPAVVIDAFRQRFAGDIVYEWKLDNNGNWKAHFMRGSVKYEATFTAAGVLVKFEQA